MTVDEQGKQNFKDGIHFSYRGYLKAINILIVFNILSSTFNGKRMRQIQNVFFNIVIWFFSIQHIHGDLSLKSHSRTSPSFVPIILTATSTIFNPFVMYLCSQLRSIATNLNEYATKDSLPRYYCILDKSRVLNLGI